MVQIGDKVPDVPVMVMTPDGPAERSSEDLLGSGLVVAFGVPGAFTPTCSDHHLPGFVLRADDLRAAGVGTIACLSVNDAFVMNAWGRAREADGAVQMVADPDGRFAAAMGLTATAPPFGTAARSRRYAAVIRDGVIERLDVEDGLGDHDVSTAEAVLTALRG